MRDDLRRFHIRSCVLDALSRHGIPHDSPLRANLEANATIAAGTDSHVIMKNGNSLDVEIEGLRSPCPAQSFSAAQRTVAKTDLVGLRDNFERIANGTAVVE